MPTVNTGSWEGVTVVFAPDKGSARSVRNSIEKSLSGLNIDISQTSINKLRLALGKAVENTPVSFKPANLPALRKAITEGIGVVPVAMKIANTATLRREAQDQLKGIKVDIGSNLVSGLRRLSQLVKSSSFNLIKFDAKDAEVFRKEVEGHFNTSPIIIRTRFSNVQNQVLTRQSLTAQANGGAAVAAGSAQLPAATSKTSNALGGLTAKTKAAATATSKFVDITSQASKETFTFGERLGFTTARLAAYLIPAAAIFQVSRGIRAAASSIRELDKEVNKLAQIRGGGLGEAAKVSEEILEISERFGQSGAELIKTAVYLAQSGEQFSGSQLTETINALAQSNLAATFGSIEDTTQGLIAVMNQFNLTGADTVHILDVAGKLSKAFAFESENLFEAVRTGGGAFALAGGSFEEFASTVAALRQLTRIDPSSIGTGLNTIALRLFRPESLQAMEQFLKISTGDSIRDAEGQLLGITQILLKLGKAAEGKNIEQLGPLIRTLSGDRQGKLFVPLIQDIAQGDNSKFIKAIEESKKAAGTLGRDASLGLKTIDAQINSIGARFEKVFLKLSQDSGIRNLVSSFSDLAKTLADVLQVAGPLLGTIIKFGTVRLALSAVKGIPGFFRQTGNVQPGPFNPGGAASIAGGITPTYVSRKAAGGMSITTSLPTSLGATPQNNIAGFIATKQGRQRNPFEQRSQVGYIMGPDGNIYPASVRNGQVSLIKAKSPGGKGQRSIMPVVPESDPAALLLSRMSGRSVSKEGFDLQKTRAEADSLLYTADHRRKQISNNLARGRRELGVARTGLFETGLEETANRTQSRVVANELASRRGRIASLSSQIDDAPRKRRLAQLNLGRYFSRLDDLRNQSTYLQRGGLKAAREILQRNGIDPYREEMSPGQTRAAAAKLIHGQMESTKRRGASYLKDFAATDRVKLSAALNAEIVAVARLTKIQEQLASTSQSLTAKRKELLAKEAAAAAVVARAQADLGRLTSDIAGARSRVSLGGRLRAGLGAVRDFAGRKAGEAGGAIVRGAKGVAAYGGEIGVFALSGLINELAANAESKVRPLMNEQGELFEDYRGIIEANKAQIKKAARLRRVSSGVTYGGLIGAQFGMAMGGPLGAAIGAAGGALIGGVTAGTTGAAGSVEAADFDLRSRFLVASTMKTQNEIANELAGFTDSLGTKVKNNVGTWGIGGQFLLDKVNPVGPKAEDRAMATIREETANVIKQEIGSAEGQALKSNVQQVALGAVMREFARTGGSKEAALREIAKQREDYLNKSPFGRGEVQQKFVDELFKGTLERASKAIDKLSTTIEEVETAFDKIEYSLGTFVQNFNNATDNIRLLTETLNAGTNVRSQLAAAATGSRGIISIPESVGNIIGARVQNVIRNRNLPEDTGSRAIGLELERAGANIFGAPGEIADIAVLERTLYGIQRRLAPAVEEVGGLGDVAEEGVSSSLKPGGKLYKVLEEVLPENIEFSTEAGKRAYQQVRGNVTKEIGSRAREFLQNPGSFLASFLEGMNATALTTNSVNANFAKLAAEQQKQLQFYQEYSIVQSKLMEVEGERANVQRNRIERSRIFGASDDDVLGALDNSIKDVLGTMAAGPQNLSARFALANAQNITAQSVLSQVTRGASGEAPGSTSLLANLGDMAGRVSEELSAEAITKPIEAFSKALASGRISEAMALATQSGLALNNVQDEMQKQTSRASLAMSLLNDKIKLLDSGIDKLTQSLQKSVLQPLGERSLDQARISDFNSMFGGILGAGGPLAGVRTDREVLFQDPEKLQEILKNLPNIANTQLLSNIVGSKTGPRGSFVSGLSGVRTNEDDAKIITLLLALKEEAGTATPEKLRQYVQQLIAAGDATKSIEQMQLDRLDEIVNILRNGFKPGNPFFSAPDLSKNPNNIPLPTPTKTSSTGVQEAVKTALAALPTTLEYVLGKHGEDMDYAKVITGLEKLATVLGQIDPSGTTTSNINVDVVIAGLKGNAKSEIARQTVVAFMKEIIKGLDVNDPAQANIATAFRNAIRSIEGAGGAAPSQLGK